MGYKACSSIRRAAAIHLSRSAVIFLNLSVGTMAPFFLTSFAILLTLHLILITKIIKLNVNTKWYCLDWKIGSFKKKRLSVIVVCYCLKESKAA